MCVDLCVQKERISQGIRNFTQPSPAVSGSVLMSLRKFCATWQNLHSDAKSANSKRQMPLIGRVGGGTNFYRNHTIPIATNGAACSPAISNSNFYLFNHYCLKTFHAVLAYTVI